MRKINRKRLNNSGFTLIELLAVVVILAVVMGIALTSVLSAMNKSRGGSLADSSIVIANAFNQKYTESLISSDQDKVYGKYNFSTNYVGILDSSLANEFGISTETYVLGTAASVNATENLETSLVGFDASTGKTIVCLVAKNGGSYYVTGYSANDSGNGSSNNKLPFVTGDDSTNLTVADGVMFACSNGVNSWEGAPAADSTKIAVNVSTPTPTPTPGEEETPA